MNMVNKTMKQLSDELLECLKNRGNSASGQNNYRYILNVMTKYCNQHNNGYYSSEVIADCISVQYGLMTLQYIAVKRLGINPVFVVS